ncbi:MAG: glycosyltransferase [Chlamydiales bacterium]
MVEKNMIHALITHLYGEEGHRYIYHKMFREAVYQLKIPYVGSTNVECPIEDLPNDWKRTLHWKEKKRGQLFVRTWDFAKIFGKKAQQPRCFFLESYTIIDLVALVFSFSFFKKQDTFLFFFRSDLPGHGCSSWKIKIYTVLFQLMQKQLKKRLLFCTDTDRIARYYQELLHQNVHLLPVPHTEGLTTQPLSDPLQLWWVGSPRKEKGEEIIRLIVRKRSRVPLALALSEELSLEGEIVLHYLPKVLTRKQYEEQMNLSAVILMPYDPNIYYSRTSGIFIEAISAGKVVVTRKGSWIASELEKHDLSELLLDWSKDDLWEKIYELAHDSHISKKIAAMQRHYREYHSLKGYTKALKAILSELPESLKT